MDRTIDGEFRRRICIDSGDLVSGVGCGSASALFGLDYFQGLKDI